MYMWLPVFIKIKLTSHPGCFKDQMIWHQGLCGQWLSKSYLQYTVVTASVVFPDIDQSWPWYPGADQSGCPLPLPWWPLVMRYHLPLHSYKTAWIAVMLFSKWLLGQQCSMFTLPHSRTQRAEESGVTSTALCCVRHFHSGEGNRCERGMELEELV